MIRAVVKEYGPKWVINRALYSAKQRLLATIPAAEIIFEHKAGYPTRLNLFRIDEKRIQELLRHLPDDKKQELVKTANEACKGIIRGFSSLSLDYGNPINWQLNPITKRNCNIKERWYRIPDFDEERGDIKIIWEASRFSHFLTLGRAYLLTEDEIYYRVFSEQLADWIENNPYGYGANYKCGQECALRMTNALLAYTIFFNSNLTDESDQRNMEALILRCYRRIRSNFFYADKCIRNNHTISELMGMIAGAWCCSEEEVCDWAFHKMDIVIGEQFMKDGGYCQYSFNYERLALQDIEAVLAMEQTVGKSLNQSSRKKLLAATDLLYQCQDETGDLPNYGSNDGALAFPVSQCDYRDFRPIIQSVRMLLKQERCYPAGMYDEEYLWFCGNTSNHMEAMSTGGIERVSKAFHESGIYTLRQRDILMMIILNDYRFRPAHMDQLHIDLWIRGINVFCDGGTFSYASEEGRALVTNVNHNTSFYDHKNQMNRRGAFLIYNWTKCENVIHRDQLFYGKMVSQNGYTHIRSVKLTDGGFRITDEILGEDGVICGVVFHTLCNVKRETEGVAIVHGEETICHMLTEDSAVFTDDYRSLYYLKKESATGIRYTGCIRNGSWKHETSIIIEGRNAA